MANAKIEQFQVVRLESSYLVIYFSPNKYIKRLAILPLDVVRRVKKHPTQVNLNFLRQEIINNTESKVIFHPPPPY